LDLDEFHSLRYRYHLRLALGVGYFHQRVCLVAVRLVAEIACFLVLTVVFIGVVAVNFFLFDFFEGWG
jgi:hypothetical protein